jgi:uncharacterized protein YceK
MNYDGKEMTKIIFVIMVTLMISGCGEEVYVPSCEATETTCYEECSTDDTCTVTCHTECYN